MWLLEKRSRKLQYFHSEFDVGEYAILSHTWGGDEVTFQEIEHPSAVRKKGYEKIDKTCRLAVDAGIPYA